MPRTISKVYSAACYDVRAPGSVTEIETLRQRESCRPITTRVIGQVFLPASWEGRGGVDCAVGCRTFFAAVFVAKSHYGHWYYYRLRIDYLLFDNREGSGIAAQRTIDSIQKR